MIVLMINTMILSQEIASPPDNAPNWWYELDDKEQWEYFKDMAELYKESVDLIHEKDLNNNKLKMLVRKNNDFLKSYNPFNPRFGMNLGAGFMIDKALEPDIFLILGTNIYFLKGRFLINPDINIKLYQDFGGGFNLKLGFTF